MTAIKGNNDDMRKRLRYRANHRGIKEMDLVLGNFANEAIDTLTSDELAAFESLLTENDHDLLNWFTGQVPFPHENCEQIFKSVFAHMTKRAG